MASGDPHISFAMRGVYHHSRGRCTTTGAPHRRERGHEHGRVVSWQSSTPTVRLYTIYPDTASTIGCTAPWHD
ncbi:hypothetical protein J1N35_041501 [Gossypium stocksii]|uniref:Uncharacterized protein n=1 Tax=Gossypium stocksii TaxID=47602 RepID=A0A9D3UHH5_9ROSI|nr:hypothetical protein J1N35_041501 [Gossypium stocksii]